tara:strand:+ start:330 stop:569 length:240 start_codon:yes stop_codon:yes gene_type:complete
MIDLKTINKEEIKYFIDYVEKFYGEDGIFPLNATRQDIEWACYGYLFTTLEWDFGEDEHRENVCDILIKRFGYDGSWLY